MQDDPARKVQRKSQYDVACRFKPFDVPFRFEHTGQVCAVKKGQRSGAGPRGISKLSRRPWFCGKIGWPRRREVW